MQLSFFQEIFSLPFFSFSFWTAPTLSLFVGEAFGALPRFPQVIFFALERSHDALFC